MDSVSTMYAISGEQDDIFSEFMELPESTELPTDDTNFPEPQLAWPNVDSVETGNIARALAHKMDDPVIFRHVMMYNLAFYLQSVYENRRSWGIINDQHVNWLLNNETAHVDDGCCEFWLFLGLSLVGNTIEESSYSWSMKKFFVDMMHCTRRPRQENLQKIPYIRAMVAKYPQGTYEGALKFHEFLNEHEDLVCILMRYVLDMTYATGIGRSISVLKRVRSVLEWSDLYTTKLILDYLDSPQSPYIYTGILFNEVKIFKKKFEDYRGLNRDLQHLLPFGRIINLVGVELLNPLKFPHLAAFVLLAHHEKYTLMSRLILPFDEKILSIPLGDLRSMALASKNTPVKRLIRPESPAAETVKKCRINSRASFAK